MSASRPSTRRRCSALSGTTVSTLTSRTPARTAASRHDVRASGTGLTASTTTVLPISRFETANSCMTAYPATPTQRRSWREPSPLRRRGGSRLVNVGTPHERWWSCPCPGGPTGRPAQPCAGGHTQSTSSLEQYPPSSGRTHFGMRGRSGMAQLTEPLDLHLFHRRRLEATRVRAPAETIGRHVAHRLPSRGQTRGRGSGRRRLVLWRAAHVAAARGRVVVRERFVVPRAARTGSTPSRPRTSGRCATPEWALMPASRAAVSLPRQVRSGSSGLSPSARRPRPRRSHRWSRWSREGPPPRSPRRRRSPPGFHSGR